MSDDNATRRRPEPGANRLVEFVALARSWRVIGGFKNGLIPDELDGVLGSSQLGVLGRECTVLGVHVVRDEDRQAQSAEIFKDETTYKQTVDPDFPPDGTRASSSMLYHRRCRR